MAKATKCSKHVVYTTIMGFTIGDALGVPVEFCSRSLMREKPVTTMTGKGMHDQPVGTWSDDSSLMFCLMEGLCSKYDVTTIMDTFVQWYKYGYWTPHGDVFDIGVTTQLAINKYMGGATPLECGSVAERNNGNGGLMRIVPMAIYLLNVKDFNERITKVTEVTALTHRHPRSILGSIIYTEYLIQILSGKDKIEAYADTKKLILENLKDHDELYYYDRILKANIQECYMSEIRSTTYVVDSLEACLWAFLTTKDYTSAVLAAVNLGGDTDTIGALTGALAGAYYGEREKVGFAEHFGTIKTDVFNGWEQQVIAHEQIKKLILKFHGHIK